MPWNFGSFGVDLFFVLSGFIIAWSTRHGQRHFLLNRAIRVLPPYWIVTALGGLIVLIAMPLGEAIGWIGRSLLFLSGPDGRPPILFVGWTLVYELVFYMIYAAALWAGRRRAPLLAVAALIVIAYGLQPIGIATRDWPPLIEFAFGLAIASWSERTQTSARTASSLLIVMAGVALLYACEPLVHARDGASADQLRLAVLGLPAAAVVLGLVQLERAKVAVPSRVVLAVGGASYAVYLLHPLVFSFALPFPAGSPSTRFGIFAALLAITIVVALAFRAAIEAPLLRLLRERLAGTPPSTGQTDAPGFRREHQPVNERKPIVGSHES